MDFKTTDRSALTGPVLTTEASKFSAYRISDGKLTNQTTVSYPKEYFYSGMNGQNIEGFHKLRKSGVLIPMTSWKQWKIEGSCYGVYDIRDSTYRSVVEGHFAAAPIETWLININTLESIAASYRADYYVQAAAARMVDKWDALTFVAELHKVVAMFKNFLRRFLTNLVRGRVDKIWLEQRYGWRTLWYDMVDIAEVLENVRQKSRTRFSERAGSKTEVIQKKLWNAQWNIPVYAETVDTIEIGLRGRVVADIKVDLVTTNILQTSWELLTYSFVIDWILNVGQAIQALSFITAQSDYVASSGKYLKVRREAKHLYNGPSSYTGTVYSVGSSIGELTLRTPSKVSSLPQLQLRLDTFKVMDLIALVTSGLSRR